jgi:hypothetical protein
MRRAATGGLRTLGKVCPRSERRRRNDGDEYGKRRFAYGFHHFPEANLLLFYKAEIMPTVNVLLKQYVAE